MIGKSLIDWLIDSYSEAGVAHADLLSSYMKKENPQGNKNLPTSACPSVALISRSVLLYHNCSLAQLLAWEVGTGG